MKPSELLAKAQKQRIATDAGAAMHSRLQRVMIDEKIGQGDDDLIAKIKKNTDLIPFFDATSRVEIPIAGYINEKFISRRIDSMIIDDAQKIITFLDYKTDVDKTKLRDKYLSQMNEYFLLLTAAFPNYKINGFILWTNDFELEKII